MGNFVSECDNCGKVDDHPKLHYGAPSGVETYHHDCIPARVARELNMEDPMLSEIVDLAKAGVHGDELRTEISGLHS